MAGFTYHAHEIQEQNRFVPTPTVNILFDRKTLKECWAGKVEYSLAPPKEVYRELDESLGLLAKQKLGTPASDAAYARWKKAEERFQYYLDNPEQTEKLFVHRLPYCSDLRTGIAQ